MEKKLAHFEDAIFQEMLTREKRTHHSAYTKLKQTKTQAMEDTKRQHMLEIKETKHTLTQAQSKNIAQAKVKALTQYVHMVEGEIARLFEDIAQDLTQFTQGEGYPQYLADAIQEATSQNPSFTTILLAPQDMHLAKDLSPLGDFTIAQGERNYIGGFLLQQDPPTAQLDFTFKTRLLALRKDFAHDRKNFYHHQH